MVLPFNLNDFAMPDDRFREAWKRLSDNSASSANRSVTVHFRDLEQNLLGYIRQAKLVVGCVAWLTSGSILRALAQVPEGVSIVVQKEDFLRPDIGSSNDWKVELRRLYDSLKEPPQRHAFSEFVGTLSYCGDPTVQPVRCVGNHNREKKAAFPRMHNKFLVFCDLVERRHGEDYQVEIDPYAVWTGSFNLTNNAAMSLENAIYLTDRSIAQAYFSEWEQILALSERLDWESDWCEPEWRVGS